MMNLILLAALLLAQSNESLHVVVLKDGTRVFGYADTRDLESENLAQRIVKVRVDAPWSDTTRVESIKGYDIEDSYEPTAIELDQYYTEQWEARGGIQIETPNGKLWVFEEEKKLADRAAAMARANEEAVLKTIRIEGDAPVEVGDSEAAAPGVGQLWGAHIAVLTLGLGLGALVVWFLILE